MVFIKTWESSGWSPETKRTLRDEAGELSQLRRDLEATLNMWVFILREIGNYWMVLCSGNMEFVKHGIDTDTLDYSRDGTVLFALKPCVCKIA